MVFTDFMSRCGTKRFWFKNLDVKNAPCSGRPIIVKVDEILEKIKQDRHISTL